MTPGEAWAPRVNGPWAREFALFGTSTFVYQGGRFVFSLAAAGALAAADFTVWALVMAILVYAPSLSLGIANGMARELPILTGAGDEQGAERAQEAAWTATAVAAAVLVLGALLAATVADAEMSSIILVGCLAAGTIGYSTAQSVLRSKLRFDAASAQQAVFGIAAFFLAITLVSTTNAGFETVAGSYGLCLAASVAVGLFVARPSWPSADAQVLQQLARIGFPIMLAGLLFSLYITLDRWIAVMILGQDEAAPYALASLVAAAVLVVPSVISQQTYPRMGIARGRDASAHALRKMARDQGLLGVGLVTPVVIGISLFAWLGIPAFLPNYVDATPSIIVLSLGLVVLASLSGYGNYLNVVGAQWRYLAAQVVGLSVAVVLMLLGGTWLGMVGIATGMSLSHVVYGLVLRATAMRTGFVSIP